MKYYYLWILLLTCFISCGDSADINTQESGIYHRGSSSIDTIPINGDNPYDLAGQIHHELLTSYYSNENLPFTLTGIINTTELIANETDSFVALTKGMPYDFTYTDRVAYIVSQPAGLLDEIIGASVETNDAKSSLKTFVTSLLTLCETEENYSVLHNYIVAYEAGVLNQVGFTPKDKQVILTSSSIARHSVYARKKRPKKNTDPDWTLLIGNITAAIDGADDSTEDAVMKGLVTGIVENSK